jgi:glutathione S-transferase
VPLLEDDGLMVWDSLAIAEYLSERFPEKQLWPAQRSARARARSVCAEMHSGFAGLRSACPMNIEASLPEAGALAMRDKPDVRADLARITQMWSALLAEYGGPMLFGSFSVADAFFSPVVMRLRTYALPVPADVAAYMQRLVEQPGVREATVVGLPDPVRGEVPVAYLVVDAAKFDEAATVAFLRSQLASFKQPRSYVRVASIPRTALGKVQKHLLKSLTPTA